MESRGAGLMLYPMIAPVGATAADGKDGKENVETLLRVGGSIGGICRMWN